MKKLTLRNVLKLLSLMIVLGFMIYNYKYYLYSSSGIVYHNLLLSGLSQDAAQLKAKLAGYLYLLFMYNGFQIPILGLIIVMIEKLFKSAKKNKKILNIAPVIIGIWGALFLSFAFAIIKEESFLILLLSTLLIWILIEIGYFIILFFINKIFSSLRKKKETEEEN